MRKKDIKYFEYVYFLKLRTLTKFIPKILSTSNTELTTRTIGQSKTNLLKKSNTNIFLIIQKSVNFNK